MQVFSFFLLLISKSSSFSLTQRPLANSETCSTPFIENILLKQHTLDVYNINTSDSSASEHSFSISSPPLQPIPSSNYSHWSKSFNYNQEEDNIMLKQKSIDSIESNYSMPMIVNVEENVEIDKKNVKSKIVKSLQIKFLGKLKFSRII